MALIEFQRVSKTYPMGAEIVRALDDVSFSLADGDYIAIRGPSGSGKSTLMHLLGCLDTPTSGTIHFDGQEFSALASHERATIRAEKIGFIFQSFNLLPRLTVLENTLLPYSYHRQPRPGAVERARRALEKVGMLDRLKHRPNQLSGGQRQRVAIARSLVNEPRLLLADEPTGNLDSKTAEMILDIFESLNREGRTIVLVTHDPHVARRCQRELLVLDGKIVPAITP